MEIDTTPTRENSRLGTLCATATCFLVSGAAALIYEVVWARMFAYTFGSGAVALAVVLSAFMAGLAIGGQAGGRIADRLRRPLLTYAVIELAIVACACLLPLFIRGSESVERTLHRHAWDEASVLSLTRFSLAFLSLILPTSLMGATLPILSRFVVSDLSHVGGRVGWLSAANTTGAVLGVCLAGFFLLPNLGISRTITIAVVLNLAAAAGAFGLDWMVRRRGEDRHGASAADAPEPQSNIDVGWPGNTVLLAVFVSGIVALASEYLWTRSLLFSFDRLKNTTYSFTCVLAVFLGGFAAGNAIAARLADRVASHRRWLGGVFVLLGAAISLSAGVELWSAPHADVVDPESLQIDLVRSFGGMIWRSVVVLGLPAILMGMVFPFAVRSLATQNAVGRWVGRVYAWNTWGAVLGAIVAGYVVIPNAGIGRGIVIVGLLDVLVGCMVLTPRWLLVPGIVGVAAAGVGVWSLAPDSWPLQTLNADDVLVGYDESPAATIAVIEDATGDRRICVDDVPVAGTSRVMQTDQKGLAHVPMLLHADPAKVLTVGFGSGGASYSLLLHNQAQQVDCVEICPAVVEFAPLLEAANHGFLEEHDPRYRVIFEDARAYLKYADEKYDVIITDCTDLRYRTSANLYDYEFFELCRQHTNDDGLTVVWMPLGGLSEEMFRLTLRTFLRVYPTMEVFYLHNEWTHFVLLVGGRDPISINLTNLTSRMQTPRVREDLAEIGLTDPAKVAATYVTGGDLLTEFIGDGEINSEETPILEFQVPRNETGPWSAQRNLDALRSCRQPVLSRMTPGLSSADMERVSNYDEAAEHIIDGQAAERVVDIDSATKAYLKARELTPDDPAITEALQFTWLRELAAEGNPTAHLFLGRVEQLQDRPTEALEYFDAYEKHAAALREQPSLRNGDMIRQANAWAPTARQWRLTAERAKAREG